MRQGSLWSIEFTNYYSSVYAPSDTEVIARFVLSYFYALTDPQSGLQGFIPFVLKDARTRSVKDLSYEKIWQSWDRQRKPTWFNLQVIEQVHFGRNLSSSREAEPSNGRRS